MTTLWFDKALLPTGWARSVRIQFHNGFVARTDVGVDAQSGDERHAIAIPGLCNLHSHAFQRAMAGLTERRGATADSFWSWRELMYRFTAKLTPDDLEAIAALAYMEMLEGGFTSVAEFHYLHHDLDGASFADPAEMAGRICAAAQMTGIGLTLLPVFYAHSGFGGAAPNEGQKRFITDPDSYMTLVVACMKSLMSMDDAILGRALHSLRAVTEGELAALTGNTALPIHIHIAEQIREVDECIAHTGQRPVEWLLDHTDVGPNWCLVHATHMTDAETARLAMSGAVAGLCPITEANLGDGVFPASAYLANGGRFGVGSDSNVLINAHEELRLLEYSQRLMRQSRNVIADAGQSTGARLFNEALTGGARALGVEARENTDFVTLDANHPSLVGKDGDDILDSLIFGTSGLPIDCVWRRGRKVVSGGRHKAREAIVAAYSRTLQRLLA